MKRVSSINSFFRRSTNNSNNQHQNGGNNNGSTGTSPSGTSSMSPVFASSEASPNISGSIEYEADDALFSPNLHKEILQQQHQIQQQPLIKKDDDKEDKNDKSSLKLNLSPISHPLQISNESNPTPTSPISIINSPRQQQQNNNNNNNNNNQESQESISILTSTSPSQASNQMSTVLLTTNLSTTVVPKLEMIKSALIVSSETVSPGRKSFTVYRIQVESNHSMYTILRRYSEFLELDLKLHSQFPLARLPFPPKKTFGKMNNEFIVQRRDHLQLFMNAAFEHADMPSDPLILGFFDQRSSDRISIQVTPASGNLPTNQVVRYIISTLPFWSQLLDYTSLLALTETCNYLYNTVSYYSDVWRQLYWNQHNILHWTAPRPVVCICTVELHNYRKERSKGLKRDMSTANLNMLLTSSPSTLSHMIDESGVTTTPAGSFTSDSSTSPSTSPNTQPSNRSIETMEYSRQVFIQLLAAHCLLRTSLESHTTQRYCDCLVPKFKGCIIGPPNITTSFFQSFETTFINHQQQQQRLLQQSQSQPNSTNVSPIIDSQSLLINNNNNIIIDPLSTPLSTTFNLPSLSNSMENINISTNNNNNQSNTLGQQIPTTSCVVSHIVSNNRMLCVGMTDASNCVIDERRFLLSQSHFVMVTFSLVDSESFDMVDSYAEDVKLMCPESPIILVGLQRDLRDNSNANQKSITYQEGLEKSKRLYNCIAYMESPSASDGVGGYRRSLLTELASNLCNHFRFIFNQPTKRNKYEIKISFLSKVFPKYTDEIIFKGLSSYEGDVEKATELLALDYASYTSSESEDRVLRNTRNSMHNRSQSTDHSSNSSFGGGGGSSRQSVNPSSASWSLRQSWNQEISKMDKEHRDQLIDGYLNPSSPPNNSLTSSTGSAGSGNGGNGGGSGHYQHHRRSVALSSSSNELQINQLVEKLKKNSVDSFIKAFLKKKNLSQDQQAEMVLSFLREMRTQLQSSQLFNINQNNNNNNEDDLTGPPLGEIENYLYQNIYKSVFSTPESLETDILLSDNMSKLVFVEPQHLEIRKSHWNRDLWAAAEKELHSVNDLYSPSQKLECILNCCKIILFLLSNSDSPGGADDFLPHLIYVVIHANIPNLHSNVEFTLKFCNSELLKMERYYYFTTFGIAVTFIQDIDAKHLKIDKDEYYAYMTGKKKYVKPSENEDDEPINEDPPTLSEVSRAKIMQKLGLDETTAHTTIASPKKGGGMMAYPGAKSSQDANDDDIFKLVGESSDSKSSDSKSSDSKSSSHSSGGNSIGTTPTTIVNPFTDVIDTGPLLPIAWTHSSSPADRFNPSNSSTDLHSSSSRNSFRLSRTPPSTSSSYDSNNNIDSNNIEHPLSAQKKKSKRKESLSSSPSLQQHHHTTNSVVNLTNQFINEGNNNNSDGSVKEIDDKDNNTSKTACVENPLDLNHNTILE